MPSVFENLTDFIRTPRVTALALAPDGSRLVATVQEPDEKLAKYVTALWEIPLAPGGTPRRLTWSEQGESAPEFAPDGALLFVSSRPDGDEAALWSLPPSGEPRRIAETPGGLGAPRSAGGIVVATGSRLVGSTSAEDDEARRAQRKDQAVTAILHDGMPIRWWDHELDVTSPRLFVIDPASGDTRDLTPDVGQQLGNGDFDLSADGTFVLATFAERATRGRPRNTVVRIEVATGARTTLLDETRDDDTIVDASSPRISPDGTRYIVARAIRGTFDTPHREWLEVRSFDRPDSAVTLDIGDVTPSTDPVWSVDGTTVFVAGDLHGAGAILALDPDTGAAESLVDDASYSSLLPHPDGRSLLALRASVDSPATPVRIPLGSPRGASGLEVRGGPAPSLQSESATILPTPTDIGELPGTVVRVHADVDGVDVPGYLFLPSEVPEGSSPPIMTWIHGGPFSSWNAWSWRWSPWLAVQRGYAVLLPDPALSTGYGDGAIARAWPHRAGVVWREIEGLLDAVLDEHPEIDRERTALLGASFGGYMTNWIAGHTDRFRCIVTHAGLWSLDQQHDTTDNAAGKNGIFGTEAEHPDWYADNSPDRTQDRIVTPMLLIHGNRDYRVPISEALRAWWDLVSGFDGPPEAMPHRFLQLPSENHWVLSPSNFRVWSETVFGFCDQHVRGGASLSTRIG
jgi:dipeptidyl aminopeptidase/acylaminoacyl peptidase